MFRYSKKGDFNVPYGGIAYNNKLMRKKLDYYQSMPLIEHFNKSHFYPIVKCFHLFRQGAFPISSGGFRL